MIVAGSASGVGTSIALPAHQVGDMIMIFARGTAGAPAVPAAGGTVPTWVTAQSAVAQLLGLTSVGAVATRADHTSGTFTNATHICVLVLRPDTGKSLKLGVSSTGNGNNTQTIVYPALTLTPGGSHGVRVGTRGVAVAAVGNPPTNWINQQIQPAGASALMSVHTRLGLPANPTADSVSTAGTNGAYRAHTIEVRELSGSAVVSIV